MKLLNPALFVYGCIIVTPMFAQSDDLPKGVPVALEQQYHDIRLRLRTQNSAGTVDMEVLQALERLGKYCQKTGEDELALQCFELIATHGGAHVAMRFLAAEMGKNIALLNTSHGVYRALLLLETQISLSPQLLELTPPGVNPDGSPLEVMATCPDAIRAKLLVDAGEYALAIPLLENVLATYDKCLGLLRSVTLGRVGMRKLELYDWLVLCYGMLLEEGRSPRCKNELRRGLYDAILGASREDPQGSSFSAHTPGFLPLAFDPMAPAVEEIRRMTEMMTAAGDGQLFMLYLVVLPDAARRSRQLTGEDLEVAYQNYLALVEELQDVHLKAEYKAYFLLRRLGNAIQTLGDRDLANVLIVEIGSLEPLPDGLVEMFANLQEAYLEQFTDASLLTLPLGGTAHAEKTL